MYFVELYCSSQEDYTVEAMISINSRSGSQPVCLPITAMLPAKGRITGICHV